MRSIGKVNLRKLNAIIDDEARKKKGRAETVEAIKGRVPGAWYDIWESAWNEIERAIDDRLWAITFGKVSL